MRVGINLEQLLFRTPGGIGRYTARLATLLPTLFPEDGYAGFVARHPGAAVAGLGLDLPIATLALPRPVLYDAWHVLGWPPLGRLARPLAHLDVVHAPSVAVPPRHGARLVVTIHDTAPVLFPGSFTGRGRWFHRRGLAAAEHRADLVIAVSQSAAEEIMAHTGIGPDRLRVVPNGVDRVEVAGDQVADVRRRFGLGDRPYVFWVGTQEPRKNLPLLVEAFSIAVERAGLPHALVLAGPAGWRHEAAAAMPGASRLGDRLRVVGFVADDELHALYKGADLFAFPSIHEGFGLPPLEAMAQGTAVLCTDRSSLPEVTAGAAVLAAPDVEGWAGALVALLEDGGRRAQLGRAGRARAAELTWERCVRATHDVYAEALSLP